jgi:chitinase
LQATITDSAGLSVTSSVAVTVNQTLTSIVLSPASAVVKTGGTQQFTARALDQFGNALAAQPGFSWSLVSGSGKVSATGLYTAPQSPGTATVQAASGGVKGTATVTIQSRKIATATFAVANDWGGGFTGNIKLSNNQSTSINSWTLQFDFAPTIYQIWNAQIVSHVGTHYVIRNAWYDATLGPGKSLTFGFNAFPGHGIAGPIHYVLNGVPL